MSWPSFRYTAPALEKNQMSDRWFDPEFVKEWDRRRLEGNATRAEQVDLLLAILAENYQPGKTILDLGMGSGQIEAALLERRADAKVVGMDYSAAMLELARQRLKPYSKQVVLLQQDLSALRQSDLPAREYQAAIAIQFLHHLTHEQKRLLFRCIHTTLLEGGLFLIVDRIAIEAVALECLYRPVWDRRECGASLKRSWSVEHSSERSEHKDDFPATLEQLLTWLRQTGFRADCLHLHLDRALIGAVK